MTREEAVNRYNQGQMTYFELREELRKMKLSVVLANHGNNTIRNEKESLTRAEALLKTPETEKIARVDAQRTPPTEKVTRLKRPKMPAAQKTAQTKPPRVKRETK